MSNQTFVKKDRISFAQNLNETIVIAPSNITTNALYIGPNSAITYDGDSNVASINYLQGVTLSNQYIYADGTYLSNLPTGIITSNLVSTVVGLGTIGYISTATGGLTENDLISSITGLGTFGYLSTNTVPSTIVGLGTFGYVSSFNSISSLNISTGNLYTGIITTPIICTITISTSVLNTNSIDAPVNINFGKSLIPFSDGTGIDIGSSNNFRWRNLWVSTISSIHITTSTLEVQNNINV